MPGLNAKISEVVAFSALIKLSDYDAQIAHRVALAGIYLEELPDWSSQRTNGRRIAFQFMPLLMPEELVPFRAEIQAKLKQQGIVVGHYFSPHISQQPYFADKCVVNDLSFTDTLGARMLSLPMSDFMTVSDVIQICNTLQSICSEITAIPLRATGAMSLAD